MKKSFVCVLSALLCVVLVFLAVPRVRADAQCVFSLSDATVAEHAKTVALRLSMNSGVPVSSAQFTVDLPEGFSLSSASAATNVSLAANSDENGDIAFYLSFSEAMTGEAALASVVIQLPEEKKNGERFKLPFVIVEGDVFDASLEDVSAAGIPAAITVEGEILYGDVNSDSSVNARDVTLLMKRLANTALSQHFDIAAADVNLDDKVNARDVTSIMKSLIGVETVRLGHRDVIEVIDEATCQKKGRARLTCKVCGDSKEIELPVADHNYELGVCTMCGQKHPDRPVIVYTDFLKRNGTLETALRGFAIYKSVTLSQYKLFESNICDSKNGALVVYGAGTFDNGLICYVSVEIAHVGPPYKLHYDAEYGGSIIASATGELASDLTVTFGETTGIEESKLASHTKIAQSIAKNLFSYTATLLDGSATEITLADFGLAAK